jgi:DNA-binding NtrC family response regulator
MRSNARVLIVDYDDLFLEVTSRMLQRQGLFCVTAKTLANTRSLLDMERSIKVAVFGFEVGEGTSKVLIQELRRIRPDLLVIGNSTRDRSGDFASIGVSKFLHKPWKVSQLDRLLTRRMADTRCA